MKNLILLSFVFTVNAQALTTISENDMSSKPIELFEQQVTIQGKQVTALANAHGMTVYIFKKDSPGKSVCTGSCLDEWPAVHVIAADEQLTPPFGKIIGNDGLPQLTVNGLPLYLYAEDTAPGDANGNYPQWESVIITH